MATSTERICSNCEQTIPADVYELHTLHCFRHRFRCDICKEVLSVTVQTEHMQDHAKLQKCPHCEHEFESSSLPKHLEECPMLPRSCDYCGAHFGLIELVDHCAQCGSRTDECPNCKSLIVLKEMTDHLLICLAVNELPEEEEPSKPRKRLRKAADKKTVKKPRSK